MAETNSPQIVTLDLGTMLSEFGTDGTAARLDQIYSPKIEAARRAGYQEGQADGRRVGEVMTKFLMGSAILAIGGVLAVLGTYFHAAHDRGLAMDEEELVACGSGNATVCLRGIQRYTGDESDNQARRDMYKAAYFNATGKTLVKNEDGVMTLGQVKVTDLKDGSVELKYRDTTVIVGK